MQKNFTKTLSVDQPAAQVFNAVMNIRSWWQGLYSEEITGNMEKLKDEFTFRAGGGAHDTTQQLVEIIPNEKLVWLVTKSNLNFLKKTDEWTGTRLVFEISRKANKTELRFTHEGLVPGIECYESCASAWTMYLEEKLLTAIKSFSKAIVVRSTPKDAFNAIINFRGWWSEEINGNTDKLNETFFYSHKDLHMCKNRLVEIVPQQAVVYEVIKNEFKFIEDKTEWNGSKLLFVITPEGDKTKVRFTHLGLTPEEECFNVCNDAWSGYIGTSLKNFIETGKGSPNPKEKDGLSAELAKKWKILEG